METCTNCGHNVIGKKFCPDCGTPVQAAAEAATATCPRCGGAVKANAAFCMHCGSSLGAQAVAAAAAPVTAVPRPMTRPCIACRAEVPATSAFCTNCGQSVQASAPASAASAQIYCNSCGVQNHAGARFCNSCGQALNAASGPAPQTGPYQQPYTQPPSQYPTQAYMQQQPQYQQPYGQPQQPQYNPNPGYPPQQPYMQGGYQQPMTLRCPVCMAMAPLGTPACPSCHTSLANVPPAPSAVPAQGQQQGGIGGFLQSKGGNMAVGALGGAAAVLGGEMLLHGIENNIERDVDRRRGYDDYRDRDRGEGLLGGLGELGNDIGLF